MFSTCCSYINRIVLGAINSRLFLNRNSKNRAHLLKLYNYQNQKGAGKYTLIFFVVLVSSVVYVAFKVIPFYYYHYELVNQFESIIRVASTETDQEIRKRLWEQIRFMQIPNVKPEDLKISREGGIMRISLKYKEVLYVTWQGKYYDLHVFDFHAYAQGRY